MHVNYKQLKTCVTSTLLRLVIMLLSLSLLVWLQQTRIGLSLFDIQGLGFLKESVTISLVSQ